MKYRVENWGKMENKKRIKQNITLFVGSAAKAHLNLKMYKHYIKNNTGSINTPSNET